MMKYMPRLAIATAALACMGAPHAATVLTFDDAIDTTYAPFAPLMSHLDELQTQGFWVDTYSTKGGADTGDFVGVLVDGANVADTCVGVVCPTNNSTQYLVAVNDGYPDIGRLDGNTFKLLTFDASFVAASGDVVLPTALALVVEGWQGNTLAITETFYFPGPASGAYSFATYSLGSAFAGVDITDVGFRGYACTTPTTCTRSLDKAQFALDNITVNAVPEPAEWLLMGLGLAAVGGLVRRRRAA
jgi:hypothetical protein